MRVTQRTMYNSMVYNMNRNLSEYVESNIQASTQKRINRPSDDPVGMTRILAYRASIEQNKRYESNTQDAASWLASTDSALTQAQVILSKIREKAEQASTGTVTPENRMQIASEVRQLFAQLVNIANTSFAGQQLFAGHKYNVPAYQIGLGMTSEDPAMQSALRNDGTTGPVQWDISGSADRTVMIRFENGAGNTSDLPPSSGTLDYSFSKDGGQTWVTKTLTPSSTEMDLDGVVVKIPRAGVNDRDMAADLQVTGYDPNEPLGFRNGTMLFIRPTAYYQGDTNDPPPQVDFYGTSKINSVNAYGTFPTDVRVRLDSSADVTVDGKVNYSYSTDNGITWQQASMPADTHVGGSMLRLNIPGGGYLDIEPQAGQTLNAGEQFVVRPRRSELGLEIAQNEFMSITNCGKDIFGGVYTHPGDTVATAAEGGAKNIFEDISYFIAWAESGAQEGCQVTLDNLTTAMEGLVTQIANVGGKINRTSLNLTILESNRDDKESRMSKIEDVDYTALLTKLAQQQLAYQTVLQSSSMIMQLNLTKFL